ncbi:MAG: Rieske (2Fe-2S) protein [bacterium]|nr:Rieske (2Fe-2S) protein [bacterium]
MHDEEQPTRRGVLASALMGSGLVLAFGTLGAQGVLFLLPRRLGPKTRLLFAGRLDEIPIGGVKAVHDLQGTAILIRRSEEGFVAFDSTCPHLGCKVHWQEDEQTFLCPCHNGLFQANGEALAGPPADAGQNLSQVPMKVDEEAGVLYLEVKDVGGGSA